MYTMICYGDLHASVLSSLLIIASKHDRSDSTADRLPDENGQLGVGLLQINIVVFINSLQGRHIIDKISIQNMYHIDYRKDNCNHTLELAMDLEVYKYTA